MINITRDEYCRFSLNGRLRLLNLFGNVVFEKITKREEVILFKISDFYVAVTKDLIINCIVDANPISSVAELEFFLSH